MRLNLEQEDRVGARNNPPPCDVAGIQRELTALGGETRGRPNLIFEWGQSATEWARGKERIKYPTRTYRETKTYAYGKPMEVAGGRTALAAQVSRITHAEWLERKGLKLPTFHKLLAWDVEWIGAPRWVIAKYVPSDKLGDTPDTWEANRYQYHDKRPELWVPSELVPHLSLWREDVNGPFPSEGRYVFFDYVKRDDGSLYGKYKHPDRGTLAHVERKLSEVSTESPVYRAQKAFKATEERWRREEDEHATWAAELLHDWRHQIAPDENPISLPDAGTARGVSRFGKTKRIITAKDFQ